MVWSAIYPVIICLANLLDKQLHCFQFAPTLCVHSCYIVTVIWRKFPTRGKSKFPCKPFSFFITNILSFHVFRKNDSSETPLKNYDPIFLTPSQLLSLAVCYWGVCLFFIMIMYEVQKPITQTWIYYSSGQLVESLLNIWTSNETWLESGQDKVRSRTVAKQTSFEFDHKNEKPLKWEQIQAQ